MSRYPPAGPQKNKKLGQVRVPLASLQPARINDQIYKPVDPTDPEVIALSESIEEHGLLQPLDITIDDVILSGHRRFAACGLAGLEVVPARRREIRSTDPEFPRLLVEFNRQRVKSRDECVREEVVCADPEEVYYALIEHREKAAAVQVDTIEIRGTSHRCKITSAKAPFLRAIEDVLEKMRRYWPLSDRQIHYALLNDPPLTHARKPGSAYRNDPKSYKSLCELLTRARLAGRIPFAAIADPTRPVTTWDIYRQPQPFVRDELNHFLRNYYRDLQQSQPNHIEIVGEKNTIESIIRPIAQEFCIPLTIGRGYCSIPPRHEMAKRFRRSGKEKLILLVLSDHDPEGEDIAHSFARSMRDDFDIECVVPVKAALTAEQVADLHLPPQMKAKRGSSRRKRFVDEFGENVWELEAVPPDELQRILREQIDSVIDVDRFNAELNTEKADAAYLDSVRRRVHDALGPIMEGGAK
jgi:hypothetical protein